MDIVTWYPAMDLDLDNRVALAMVMDLDIVTWCPPMDWDLDNRVPLAMDLDMDNRVAPAMVMDLDIVTWCPAMDLDLDKQTVSTPFCPAVQAKLTPQWTVIPLDLPKPVISEDLTPSYLLAVYQVSLYGGQY